MQCVAAATLGTPRYIVFIDGICHDYGMQSGILGLKEPRMPLSLSRPNRFVLAIQSNSHLSNIRVPHLSPSLTEC